jgi:protein-disulfide isomerase
MATLKVPLTPEDHVQGDPNAELTLLEYGDYECPHCGRAHPIVKGVQQHFGPRLRFVFRNFPLTQVHSHAQIAAEAAEFAATHGRFWEMHDLIYENQDRLGLTLLVALAGQLGLDPQALRDSLSAGEFEPRVRRDFMGGVRSGVNGTPTFFVNDERHDGPWELEDLVTALEARLVGGSGSRRTPPRA